MSKHLEVNHQSLITSYYDYYKEKIAIRETFENINKINNEKYDYEHFELIKEPEKILKDSFEPIKNLLFIFRNNFDYVTQLISIIDEKIPNISYCKVNSLIELLCHQFYDNILIPNPEQEELLILCYLLLQKEIEGMNSSCPASFLDENSTCLGILLKTFTRKQELKNFLSMTLGDLILSIDNCSDRCLSINPTTIQQYVGKVRDSITRIIADSDKIYYPLEEIDNNKLDLVLRSNIPKTKIKYVENRFNFDETENSDSKSKQRPTQTPNGLKNEEEKNSLYDKPINQDLLNELIKKEKDNNLKEFYLRQLERINKNPGIFTNNKLCNLIEDTGSTNNLVLETYKNNYLYITEKIDQIIQQLMDKITTIPYTIRCICKIIHCLISQKFPKISSYEKNAFVGEFIFGKWIFPILINSDINAIITTNILQNQTRSLLKNIAKVLIKLNRGQLFDENIDTGFTIFNHYILEVIPLINVFYNKLIDVELPRVLDQLIQKQMTEPVISSFKRALLLKNSANNTQINKEAKIDHDYFKEYPDESINIQCACFSIQDVLFLYEELHKNTARFSHLPKFTFFQKTIEKIGNEIPKLVKESKAFEKRPFFLVFKEFQFQNFQSILNEQKKKMVLSDSGCDPGSTLEKIKFCIKTVLKGLNLINSKDYPYLNFATTNNNFFYALNKTLEDIEDDSEVEESNKIPLKWYAQYMINNKSMLPIEFKQKDYEELYTDLLYEERKSFILLKKITTMVFTKSGMNMRCAEKKIERVKKDFHRIDRVKSYMKMQMFTKKTPIESCITITNPDAPKEEREFGLTGIFQKLIGQSTEKPKPPECTIKVENGNTCIHMKMQMLQQVTVQHNNGDNSQNKQKKNEHHATKLDDFIKKLKDYGMKNFILQEDVQTGVIKHKLYKTFEDYLGLVRETMNESTIYKEDTDQQKSITLERIEDHIMKQIYIDTFPAIPLKKDDTFYKKTLSLEQIKPSELGIKETYINDLDIAIKCIQKIDNGKSVYEKLKCIASAYNTINNTIKFASGKDADGGAEDLSPIFQYIIIKAQPRRFFSNIYYLKTFLNPSKYKGMSGFLLSQLEFAAEFITKFKKEE